MLKVAVYNQEGQKVKDTELNESVFGIEDVPKLLEPISSPISSDTYKIRRFDLDLNKHVHNLNYLNIAYELLPDEVYDGDELNKMLDN